MINKQINPKKFREKNYLKLKILLVSKYTVNSIKI